MRRIAISDIHGCARTFRNLLRTIELTPEDHLFLLGDYVDRGPDSKGVLDTIFELQAAGYRLTCLKGNHEEGLEWALESVERFEHWLFWGGDATLSSFGASHPAQIPERYLCFLESLPPVHIEDRWIMVHAGLDFKAADPLANEHALMWIRNWYDEIDYEWLGDRYIVHGHDRTTMPRILTMRDQLDHLRVQNIDCGCFDLDTPGSGHLCAFDLDARTLWFEPNADMLHPWRR